MRLLVARISHYVTLDSDAHLRSAERGLYSSCRYLTEKKIEIQVMSDVLERLQRAALVLTQNAPVKDRLAEAWLGHLQVLDAGQLPEHFRGEFSEMCEAMTRERPLPRENPVRASVRKMSNAEAGRYAALVVRLYGAVARNGGSSGTPRQPPLAPSVQLFAAQPASSHDSAVG
jgi:hypothetical protein